ncbi:MAG: hypothetical protein JW395_3698 [Nitrospira sp.]|nr:hypothetical protein [Nitrospira sp.]
MVIENVDIDFTVDHCAGKELKLHAELIEKFLLPLFNKTPRGDDQAACQIASENQFLDVKPTHDGLTCARVIS